MQTGTGPTVIRLSDEAETGVNLATTESIGEQPITGGCLAITVVRGHRRARRRAGTPRPGRCWRPTAARRWARRPPRAWEHGRFGAPYLRDSLLSAGALCETLETATNWSNLAALKAAVTEALTTALAESGTPALVLCHISHVYPTGASLYFTVVAGQRGNPIEQWRKAKSRGVRRDGRAAARRSPTTTPSAPTTGRGCATRSATSASRCCARSRPCSIRPESSTRAS